jgi:hypothetical protein
MDKLKSLHETYQKFRIAGMGSYRTCLNFLF